MPEIKHTFTAGKMNKDLDERLVRDGEYRDAMNIQVSTSEGSDVGTVQNILGNSLVGGQGNISGDTHCVGSISDEKNDKLYWFITNKTPWVLDGTITGDPNGKVYKDYIVEHDTLDTTNPVKPVFVDKWMVEFPWIEPNLSLVGPQTTFELENINDIDLGMKVQFLGPISTFERNITSITPTTGAAALINPNGGTVTVDAAFPASLATVASIYNYSVLSGLRFIRPGETRTIGPTFIDSSYTHPAFERTEIKRVLDFDSNINITGINIVDDMLFWTDNHSEPKKINIPRCKAGTFNFNTQTRLINESQGFDASSNIPLKEEHVTIIKKSPPTSPTIKLQSERFSSEGKIHTGVMRITSDYNYPTVAKTLNPSSFNVWTEGVIRHDFSGLGVDDTFVTEIETDIHGNSGFSLDWKTGDTVMIKEFEDDVAPRIPITDYRIKAKILDRVTWDSGTSSPVTPRLTDAVSEMLEDTNGNFIGDFITPNSTGFGPKGWSNAGSWSSTGKVTYSAIDSELLCVDAMQHHKVRTSDTLPFAAGETYTVEYTVSKIDVNGTDEFEGGISAYIAIPDPVSGTQVYKTTRKTAIGTHTESLTLSGQGPASWSAGYLENKFFFQFTGNGNFTNQPELIDVNTASSSTIGTTIGPHSQGNAWRPGQLKSISFDYTEIDDANHLGTPRNGTGPGASNLNTLYFNNIMIENLRNGARYELELEFTVNSVSHSSFDDYEIGISTDGGVSSSARFDESDFTGTLPVTATKTIEFDATSSTKQIDIFVRSRSKPTGQAGIDTIALNAMVTGNAISIPTNGYDVLEDHISSVFGIDFDAQVSMKKEIGFTGKIENVSVKDTSTANAMVALKITAINGIPPQVESPATELRYAIDKQDTEEKLFEFKFPRFATRYKYEDGEYSAFSPFSEIAFLPGSFDYHPKKGYNLGMTNRTKTITIEGIDAYVPNDVVSVDILYKDELSPNIYVVDTIKPDDWGNPYIIESETISRIIPSNQLLRPWDNVPRKALAQDIVGNRLVYGNYIQGYNLKDIADNDYNPNFTWDFTGNDITSDTVKSMKSLREYQLGIVFIDKYGRETPVISNQRTAKTLPKTEAAKSNQISVSFHDDDHVKDMKYFKFYVKETSGEYYNMAMDRFWDADDDHVWVSFPSSDRNKIDIDTFLILKKGIAVDDLVTDPARYKVIAIENEAPEFIKNKVSLIEEKTHVYGGAVDLFKNNLDNAPLSGRDNFKMNFDPFFDSSGSNLHEISETLYVEFTKTGEEATSSRYEISSITTDYVSTDQSTLATSTYNIKLRKNLGEDVDFMSDTTKIKDSTIVRIYKYEVKNSPEFDGRFFVKVINDDIFNRNIKQNASIDLNYRVLKSQKLYYMNGSTHNSTHAGTITGQNTGRYNSSWTTPSGSTSHANDFGRFAPFFRNYNSEDTSITINGVGSNPAGTGALPVNQYIFGDVSDAKFEFREWTGELGHWAGGASSSNITAPNSSLKKADKAAGKDGTDDPVWFIDGGNYAGRRHTNEHLHWTWIDQDSGQNSGIDQTVGDKYSYLNIAMGGIFHSEISDQNDTRVGNFFNVGMPDGNLNYRDGSTVSLVDKFYPARQFRFREDHNANVYTILPSVEPQRLLRYSDGTNATDPTSKPYSIGPWTIDWDRISMLSPNFTRNWLLKIKNQNETNTNVVDWDPTEGGSLGPITNGLKLTIAHSADAAPVRANITPKIAVKVDTLVGTHTDGSSHQIKEGMILTSHSNGTTGNTDGSETDEDWLVIWQIEEVTTGTAPNEVTTYNLYLTGYSAILSSTHDLYTTIPAQSQNMVFEQPAMNGYSEYSANRINANSSTFTIDTPGLMAIGYHIDFIEAVEIEDELPSNPAIWETEPKESADLDIYYEASGLNPILLTDDTKSLAIPIGSTVSHVGSNLIPAGTTVDSITSAGTITLSTSVLTGTGFINAKGVESDPLDKLKITKPDGSSVTCTIISIGAYTSGTSTNTLTIDTKLYSSNVVYDLNWFNCYSFGNGVESNRIRDNFNLAYISNGVKASTVLEEGEYKEEHRKYGLIYSGLYNSTSGINNLNQFIQAEKITKDINPIYGSVQKLHTRDTDLVTLCEDKVLRILASKDAVYNADGNPNLTATQNVLGQTIPFVGEYGISKNPESFVSEAYRSYFTDKQRGAVMRLSRDGLTPISMHGMKDWFRDNLKASNKLIGSYDDRNDEYNITIGDVTTVSFREDVRGWISFKSFVPENAVSCANNYFTILDGKLYKHYDDTVGRNTFYGNYTNSSINVVLNDQPGSVKSFHTLDYEGSQSRVEGIRNITVDGIVYSLADGTNPNSYPDGMFFYMSEEDFNTIVDISHVNTEPTGVGGVVGNTSIPVKQYRDNILIWTGLARVWNDPAGGGIHGVKINSRGFYIGIDGDWQVGDVITTQQQEETVNHFNSMPKDGWYVSNIETDKQEGNLHEFIEKEGKWFNYIKGIDSDVDSTTDFGSFDIQGIGTVDSMHANEITFASNINSSLQIGDTLYFERLSEVLGEELIADGDFASGNIDSAWIVNPELAWSLDGGIAVSGVEPGVLHQDVNGITEGELYEITYDITVISTGGELVLSGHGVGGIDIDLLESNTVATHKVRWVQGSNNTNTIMIYSSDAFDGTIDNISVKEVNTGKVFGFTRIESDQLQKCGVVTNLTNNTVTVDNSGTLPTPQDYIMFAKNQSINTSSLSGYYADAMFKNNSIDKAELFSVSSEVTESSK